MNPKRAESLKLLGCICCQMNLDDESFPGLLPTFLPVEIHHLNGGGHHGQKRRGDDFTIPLCVWHHRGQGVAKTMTAAHGPSWAKGSKPFRAVYGTDDELLALVNSLIEPIPYTLTEK